MPSFDYESRQDQARAISGVDAVALVPGKAMYYFTGLDFHLSERPTIVILLPDGRTGVITPELEMPRLIARPDLEIEAFPWNDTDGYAGAFEKAVEALGLRGKGTRTAWQDAGRGRPDHARHRRDGIPGRRWHAAPQRGGG